MTTRRELLVSMSSLLASVALTSVSTRTYAQIKPRRIGYLTEGNPSAINTARTDALKAGLRELGYVEGRDYTIEQRFAQRDRTRLPALAAELIALKVEVILTTGTNSSLAAREVTHTVPIVFAAIADPVATGLVSTLSRPGGNLTGLTATVVGTQIGSKRVDLLRQILPGMRRVGLIYDAGSDASSVALKQFEADCRKLELRCIPVAVRKSEELDAAFATLQREHVQGLVVGGAGMVRVSQKVIDLAHRHRLPAIYGETGNAEAGGLMSYHANSLEQNRRAAVYVDKILKGAKPGDLPVEQPTKYELIINQKTARAIGLTVPQDLLLRADRVIE